MPQAFWTPIAESDLDDILYYIALEDGRPETAINIYYELRGAVDHRAVNEIPGRRLDVAPDAWRYFPFKRWLIFFQPHPDGIEVMRVIDGARDLPNHL